MPDNSHVSRSDVKINGVTQKLYRRSVPFGGVLEHGAYFLAFSGDRRRFDHILQSIFGVSSDGVHDHLTEFSTPVSGSYWFATSATELFAIGPL
jgi:putative iron-dependent peroxidase